MKSFKWYLKWFIMVGLIILPLCVIKIITNNYTENEVSKRWSKDNDSAHIGVYISREQNFSVNDIMMFREGLKNKLKESDVLNSKNGNSMWSDCYAARNTVNLSDGELETEITAYGVGDDFFLFHPFTLVSGSYFSGENVSKDLIVIDEDMAWRYFGSTDIEGMEIYVDGKLHIISGVIKRDEGMFQTSAGNGKSSIYMSYESLLNLKGNLPITSYEVVMPNLTKDYARKIVKDNIEISESKCEIVECSNRYSFESLLKVIKNVGKRSMKMNTVVYPYWENVERGMEDVCALIMVIWLIFISIITVYILIKLIIYIYKNGNRIKICTIERVKILVKMIKKFILPFLKRL